MAEEFAVARGLDLESRVRKIEAFLAESSGRPPASPSDSLFNEDGGGGGGGGGIPGGGAPTTVTLYGDVTGLSTGTTVERIENVPIPAPVAGNDEQFVRYQHTGTPAFEYAHVPLAGDVTGNNTAAVVERIRGTPIPAPTGADDERFVKFEATGTQFVYEKPALGGDVTGNYDANTVTKIRNRNINAPVAGDDFAFVRYDLGTNEYVYAQACVQCFVGAWTHADISTLAGADAQITNSFTGTAIANPMPTNGALLALVVKLAGDVGGAGVSVTVTTYLNGVATLLAATITGGAGTEDEAVVTLGTPISFVAGDDIACYAKITGAVAAVRALATVWGRLTD